MGCVQEVEGLNFKEPICKAPDRSGATNPDLMKPPSNRRLPDRGRTDDGAKMMSKEDAEIEDMDWNEELRLGEEIARYGLERGVPCGHLFQIAKHELRLGEEIARCPIYYLYSASIYNVDDFKAYDSMKNEEPRACSQQLWQLREVVLVQV